MRSAVDHGVRGVCCYYRALPCLYWLLDGGFEHLEVVVDVLTEYLPFRNWDVADVVGNVVVLLRVH